MITNCDRTENFLCLKLNIMMMIVFFVGHRATDELGMRRGEKHNRGPEKCVNMRGGWIR